MTQIPFAFSYQCFIHSSSLLKIHEETAALVTAGYRFHRGEKGGEGGKVTQDSLNSLGEALSVPPPTAPCR